MSKMGPGLKREAEENAGRLPSEMILIPEVAVPSTHQFQRDGGRHAVVYGENL